MLLLTNIQFIVLTKIFLFGMFYFFILCFVLLLILVVKAPTYVEKEDGTLFPLVRKGTLRRL